MVMQKRLDYGFNGYQFPFMPRAARSARRRGSFGSRVEDKQMCAFDLLASVAGKLLLKKGTTSTSSNTSTDKDQFEAVNDSVKGECPYDGKPFKEVTCDERSCDKSFFVSEILSLGHDHRCKEDLHMLNEVNSGVASLITSVDCSERLDVEKLGECRSNNSLGSIANKVDVGSDYGKPDKCKLDSATRQVVNGSGIDTCSLDYKMARDGKPLPANSDSSTKVPLCGNQIPQSSFPAASRDDVNLISKDDDEKPFGCTYSFTSKKFFRRTPHIGDQRIRKILATRHWKKAPKSKGVTLPHCNADKDMKTFFSYRKEFYKCQRSERIYPFKKRKHFDCSSASNSDGGICSEFLSDNPSGRNNVDGSCSYLKMNGAIGASSTVSGQNTSFQSRDSHVKLRIRSFRVPELFIEIPESATVGSLKRTVMEAVTAILGGGLRVGVLLQGKKVRDDNKSLLQTGISQDNHLDALGFSLEPHSSKSLPPLRGGDTPLLLPGDISQPLTSPGVIHNSIRSPSTEPHMANICNIIESDHDSVPSPTDMSVDKSTMDCKALIPVPAMSVEALAVVPVHRKSKRCKTVQRRIRRPFSVAEVEALVQAVEKLGTGRWRDVKLRAFDNAKHRTYVDLKDKWKTLVHTARISPQQRRGEPVPQELLDRVLTAHAYWSRQQAKHQLKQQPETCFVL
ncbi:telomere repeat-binding protein 5 isoform X2 [Tripterygium wilfordii]|uniref:telomere repeat-binding protein 5 isoform X2 n=1 Tax=Tripterygium wilfordii TaxID=458696 RepID=UPI0018F843FC|nr:telomere repeat-binding protein 5 isoform X2 [Tripterygium wilfordii]